MLKNCNQRSSNNNYFSNQFSDKSTTVTEHQHQKVCAIIFIQRNTNRKATIIWFRLKNALSYFRFQFTDLSFLQCGCGKFDVSQEWICKCDMHLFFSTNWNANLIQIFSLKGITTNWERATNKKVFKLKLLL